MKNYLSVFRKREKGNECYRSVLVEVLEWNKPIITLKKRPDILDGFSQLIFLYKHRHLRNNSQKDK